MVPATCEGTVSNPWDGSRWLCQHHAVTTVLERIVAAHRQAAAADRRPLGDLLARAAAMDPPRGFRAALHDEDGLSVIAEIKRRSPSRGDLAPDLAAADLATAYAAGGAACLSVLTDAEWFGGSPADLAEARDASGLPVLRKDFTVCRADVADARIMGADAVLLIVSALADDELHGLIDLARQLLLDALVEVHDEHELERALATSADLVGVNQRDLHTFDVDHDLARRVAMRIPDGVVRVAESGVRDASDARRLRAAGYDALLVGETLVTATDPAGTIRELKGG
jgi:indole-3-glycerol phosphate synthase